MRLIYKKPVNAQLLKVITSSLRASETQLFQLRFSVLRVFFHLFDAEIFACIGFQFFDGGKCFINLLLNNALLPFIR